MTIYSGARGLTAALSLVLALCAPALAQGTAPAPSTDGAQKADSAGIAAARELLRASNTDKAIAEKLPLMFDLMTMAMLPSFAEVVPDDQREAFNKSSGAILAEAKRKALDGRASLLAQIEAAYVKALSVDEMKAGAAFYRSPAGKKFHNATPELQAQIVDIAMKIAYDKPIEVLKGIDPAQLEAAREMLAASRLDRTINTVVLSMTERGGDEVIRGILAKRKEMKDAFAALYARSFADKEMKEVTAFYVSPEGVKLAETLPGLVKQTQTAMVDYLQSFGNDAAARLSEGQHQQGKVHN